MTGGLVRLLTLTFGAEGNEANYLGSGWSGDEPGLRWMVGPRSELWLENQSTGPNNNHNNDLVLELDIGVIEVPIGHAAPRLLVGVRGKGIAQIGISRGGAVGFHIPAALGSPPGPMRIQFVHPDFRKPMDLYGGSDDRELSFSVRGLRLFRVLPRPTPVAEALLGHDRMIMRFESLGDNCEFGLVQRRLGAEPLGLLRFSFIELPALERGLRCGFDGLGDPASIDVIVEGHDREFVVKESVYGMTYHTFQYEHQISLDMVRQQQIARLHFLKRKLMEDAATGEKIFVIKRNPPLRPEEVLPLYTTLNELGCNCLLWMVPADAAHPSGTVEMLLPGLLRGYIDRFAPSENAHDLSLSAWTAVCEAAWRAAGNQIVGTE
jgi:hypothetical protein